MKLRHRLLIAILLAPALLFAQTGSSKPKPESLAPGISGGKYPVMSPAAKGRALQLYGYFESGQSAQLFAALSPEMKKNNSSARMAAMAREIATQWGREEKMLGENFAPELLSVNTVYQRYAQFSKSKNPIFTLMVIDEKGQMQVMQFQPVPLLPGNRFADYQNKTTLKLPFTGDWFVYQGGRLPYQTPNAFKDMEAYELSFAVLKDGRPFSGDGSKNEQFYCYGQPVSAPADGTVVEIRNTVADNPPGQPEQAMPAGNRVIIYHGNQEYSLLSHLKLNSIKVKSGDKVKQGDVVAECGNSGSSSAPHLAYQLQNSKGRPLPISLPARFADYVADGKQEAWGEPVRGQFVHSNAAVAASAANKE
jgi:hypothetical protein